MISGAWGDLGTLPSVIFSPKMDAETAILNVFSPDSISLHLKLKVSVRDRFTVFVSLYFNMA